MPSANGKGSHQWSEIPSVKSRRFSSRPIHFGGRQHIATNGSALVRHGVILNSAWLTLSYSQPIIP